MASEAQQTVSRTTLFVEGTAQDIMLDMIFGHVAAQNGPLRGEVFLRRPSRRRAGKPRDDRRGGGTGCGHDAAPHARLRSFWAAEP